MSKKQDPLELLEEFLFNEYPDVDIKDLALSVDQGFVSLTRPCTRGSKHFRCLGEEHSHQLNIRYAGYGMFDENKKPLNPHHLWLNLKGLLPLDAMIIKERRASARKAEEAFGHYGFVLRLADSKGQAHREGYSDWMAATGVAVGPPDMLVVKYMDWKTLSEMSITDLMASAKELDVTLKVALRMASSK